MGLHPFSHGLGQVVVAGSPSPSLRGFGGGSGGSVHGVAAAAGIMDEGGEWEREGLGRGLEERLDWVR